MNFLKDLKDYDKDNIPVSFKKYIRLCDRSLRPVKVCITLAD